MVPLLMTRPLPAAERFVASLPEDTRAGLEVIHAPLIEIRPTGDVPDLSAVKTVIFTSANGVETASRETPQRLPAVCVGTRTAQVATALGWGAEVSGSNAQELLATLKTRTGDAPFLHLRGTHARGGIAAGLQAAGIACREQVIYDQHLLPLSGAAEQVLAAQRDVIVPLFSPRTARHFANLCKDARHLHVIVLSSAVAEPVEGLNYKTLRVSKAQNAAAMVAAVRDAAAQLSRLEGDKPAE